MSAECYSPHSPWNMVVWHLTLSDLDRFKRGMIRTVLVATSHPLELDLSFPLFSCCSEDDDADEEQDEEVGDVEELADIDSLFCFMFL